MKTSEIHIRDPFIFVDGDRYIMTGTTNTNGWNGDQDSILAYVSTDLQNWEFAATLFEKNPGFWGTMNYWASEIHEYKGSYFMFTTFAAPGRCHATSALRADNPLGPYTPWGAEQLTPMDWECLDGTLYVDDDGKPWLVFCHEWRQVIDGEVCAVPLKDDLSGPDGEPTLLFRASEAPWVVDIENRYHGQPVSGKVTDGPFMFRSESGKLCMLWSSFCTEGYAISVAVSEGGVLGPWKQEKTPFFGKDGGHGMLFTTLCGKSVLSIHAPNILTKERAKFILVRKTADGLEQI